jgi:hypothetical protein
MPYSSRGVVRLVAYMIRKTLGWCDEDGNPQHATVEFSYSELEKYAGLSHSMIRLALNEATKAGFIHCLREGSAKTKDSFGQSSSFELAWDEGSQYVKDPTKFKGFYAGDGNRTYIPNQFFDELIPKESLATIQVVGSIIRFSIGFVNKYGYRRQRVALSYLDIQRYGKIASPRIVSTSIKNAIAKSYIECVEEGYFDPNGGMHSRSAHYALKWASNGRSSPITPKSEAGADHSEKYSGITPKSVAVDHSEKCSGIQIKQINKTLKQQESSPEAAASFEKLKEIGFDARAAEILARKYSFAQIDRQIQWIDRRKVKKNRLGMLRRAIEDDWARPEIRNPARQSPEDDNPLRANLQAAVREIERRLNNSLPS